MRKHGKVDANHAEIVAALRRMGCSVISLAPIGGGCGDILVGRRGINLMFEIKDGSKPPSECELTHDEKIFHAQWAGQISTVYSAREAIELVRIKT